MKIVLIQEAGQHKENFEFKEALCFQRAFTRMGIEALVCGKGYNADINARIQSADAIIVLQNYDLDWIPDLSSVVKPKFFWSIDSHKNKDEHLRYCIENKIGNILVSTYNDVPFFRSCTPITTRAFWFPNCYPSDLIMPIHGIKKYSIGFCGNYGNRREWLSALEKIYKIKLDIMVIGDDMVKAINSYDIHFNRNEADDINGRTFETMGCATLLLTNETPGIFNIFEEGKHLLTYKTIGECFEKIKYFIKKKEARDIVAKQGYEQVLKFHTYDKRAELILNIFNERG